MDNKIYENYSHIVKGVARRYAGPFGMIYDDIEQELWAYLIEKVNKGKQLTPGLVARMCYDHAVDIYRKQRKYHDSVASISSQDYYTYEEEEGSSISRIQSSKMVDTSTVNTVLDVIKMYEVGSRERRYIICKLYNAGIIDKELFDLPDDQDSMIVPPDSDSEEAYQGILPGLNNRKISGSWLTTKKQMKYEIYRALFGLDTEDDLKKYIISRMLDMLHQHKNKICWYCWLIKDTKVVALRLNDKDYILNAIEKYGKSKFYKVVDKDGYTGYILKDSRVDAILKKTHSKIDETDIILR